MNHWAMLEFFSYYIPPSLLTSTRATLSMMEDTYIGITLTRGFYVNT
jgi:hypothetical protein